MRSSLQASGAMQAEGEIKRCINELSRKRVAAGRPRGQKKNPKKKRVTNVEITPVNDTVGVRAAGVEGLILMRITKPPSHPTVSSLLW